MQHADGFNTDVINMALMCLLPFVIAFSFLIFVFYRKRRELIFKQKELELKQQVADVEMKALRAQMNPHFIFNCMNSIYGFMHNNDLQKAETYLIKISNLIRLVLENSMHTEVSLKDDLAALQLYIELEQIRMVQGFNYTIETDPALNIENTLVPPLILQPFVENSIWHGLNGKASKGTITIKIGKQNEMLKYTVEDNGTQEKAAADTPVMKAKKKSLGMSLTSERLEVLNKTKNTHAHFNISDIRDVNNIYKGKRVELFLPYEENL
ncbi:MAG: histidine kinase [Bacteroidia bacterium]